MNGFHLFKIQKIQIENNLNHSMLFNYSELPPIILNFICPYALIASALDLGKLLNIFFSCINGILFGAGCWHGCKGVIDGCEDMVALLQLMEEAASCQD